MLLNQQSIMDELSVKLEKARKAQELASDEVLLTGNQEDLQKQKKRRLKTLQQTKRL